MPYSAKVANSIGSYSSSPRARQYSGKVGCPRGVGIEVAKPSDFRFMFRGMSRHVCMGDPKMRCSTPRARRWVASPSPSGPAPIITTATEEEFIRTDSPFRVCRFVRLTQEQVAHPIHRVVQHHLVHLRQRRAHIVEFNAMKCAAAKEVQQKARQCRAAG